MLLFLSFWLFTVSLAFQIPAFRVRSQNLIHDASVTQDDRTYASLPGVSDFEQWFQSFAGASCDSSIQHALFGTLRGLTWTDGSSSLSDKKRLVANIPSNMCLQSDYTQPDWDAQLASQLCQEVKKGSTSEVSGYISLLTQGTMDFSLSTAPNALRHWTDDQRAILKDIMAGQRLLELEQRQEALWRKKYDALLLSTDKPSWGDFHWAMEVVHSRAFCGIGQSSTISVLPSLLVPIAAAAIGWAYNFATPEPSYAVLAILAVIAAAPTAMNLIQGEGPSTAVLLPLIDSANHWESADSTIDFDPVTGSFQLSIGPKCLQSESDGQTQLYISYGSKHDSELMLNYGFLPTVPCADGEDEAARDQQRKQLAKEYLKRNHV